MNMTMTTGRDVDEVRVLAWIAITWIAMRALSSCTFAVFEWDFVAWRTVAVQVQTGGGERTTSRRCHDAGEDWKQESKAAHSSPQRKEAPRPAPSSRPSKASTDTSRPQVYRNTNCSSSPPPPYSPTPLPSPNASPDLIPLYEDIIASDAQTIQTQQQTLAAQQEIIRAQAQMIQELRHVLEEQDRTMEEVDESIRGQRFKRGMGDMRSRSA